MASRTVLSVLIVLAARTAFAQQPLTGVWQEVSSLLTGEPLFRAQLAFQRRTS